MYISVFVVYSTYQLSSMYLCYVLSLCVSDRVDGRPYTVLLRKATSGPSRSSWTGGQTSRPGIRYAWTTTAVLDHMTFTSFYPPKF